MAIVSKFQMPDGTTLDVKDTTYNNATQSAAGLMSAADKTKLDGIANNANKYSLPTASASTKGGIKIGSNLSMSGEVLNAKDTTYSNATQSAAGLMSATDKTKLDGIGTFLSNIAYTGQLTANGKCPNKVTLSAGKWLITTSGYVWHPSADYPIPFGLGFSNEIDVKGMQPCWQLSLTQTTDIYIWNLLGINVDAYQLDIVCTKIGG